MKSDVFHAYDPTSVRESMTGVRMTGPSLAINDSQPIQQSTIGYKSPLSSDLIRYSTRLERRNDDIPRKATLCRICPQYGHAIIFSRKCYYQAQCILPALIHRMKTRAGKAGNMAVATDASKQVGYVGSVLTIRFGQPTFNLNRAPAPDSLKTEE